jgi:ribosomal protein L11 methyltransferase
VVTDSEAVEAVSEILGRVSPSGTSVEPGFDLVEEGLAARVDPALPVTVRAFVPARPAAVAERAAVAVEEALGHLRAFNLRPIGELTTRTILDADWADAWKRHFPVLRVGRRTVIRPTWRRHERLPGDVVVVLDPGRAFGTGLHPTTQLCLAAIEDAADQGRLAGARVLDLGCGSGILAIGAVRHGAASALGLDIDPIAVAATQSNAARNRVGARVSARLGGLPSGEPPYDLVVANLIASLLVQLAPGMAAELRPGGRLVASGIFVDREREVAEELERAGFVVEARRADGDWVALLAIRSVDDARPDTAGARIHPDPPQPPPA